MFKAHYKLVKESGQDAELFRSLTRYLNYGFDKYVHGGYITAMELYDGRRQGFMLSGQESARSRCTARVAIVGKLYEVVAAFECAAHALQLVELKKKCQTARKALEDSDEQSTERCSH